jgi:hypothetical protein
MQNNMARLRKRAYFFSFTVVPFLVLIGSKVLALLAGLWSASPCPTYLPGLHEIGGEGYIMTGQTAFPSRPISALNL